MKQYRIVFWRYPSEIRELTQDEWFNIFLTGLWQGKRVEALVFEEDATKRVDFPRPEESA